MPTSAAPRLDDLRSAPAERRFVLHGVPWWMYVALRDATDHRAGLKLTYLAGDLELTSPSMLHEDAKWRPHTNLIAVHGLVADRYELRERSEALPDLDLTNLSRFVQPGENQTRLAKAYQATLRGE